MNEFIFIGYRPSGEDNSSDITTGYKLSAEKLVDLWAQCMADDLDPRYLGWCENHRYHIFTNGEEIYNGETPLETPYKELIKELEAKTKVIANKLKDELVERMNQEKKKREDKEREERRKEFERLKQEFEPN